MKNQVVLSLDNEIEAHVFTSILDQSRIPYTLRSFHDVALDGLFHNWGQIVADFEFADRINDLLRDMDEEF
ncbi:MAG: hypothetical protein QM786_13675 [Breznakibacter sp.]